MKPIILIVEDHAETVFGYTQYLTRLGYDTAAAITLQDADVLLSSCKPDAILLDMKLPDGSGVDWIVKVRKKSPDALIVMITAHGDVTSAVEAMQNGADHFFSKPVNLAQLVAFLKKKLDFDKLRRRDEANSRTVQLPDPHFGNSPAMKKIFDLVSPAAATDTVVLLQGKTGTGKGVLARWIHEKSLRSSEPFVEVNCASLRGDLLNSELFGHAKGSFTSAVSDRQGLIEVANRGTLFLDEIGDMEMSTQAQLLKAIEQKTYRRIGESKERTSDFRLVCATNRDLMSRLQNGTFREDLYYRICVFPIVMPSLQDRMDDFSDLVNHILVTLQARPMEISGNVIDYLKEYDWPGNIRELKNMLERALILSGGERLEIHHFPGLIEETATLVNRENPDDLEAREEQQVKAVLARFKGNTIKAARMLGISRASLYRKMGNYKHKDEESENSRK